MLQPVDRGFNVAVKHIAGLLFPAGFDVADVAPVTLGEIRRHVASTGRMLVWSGMSGKTCFACPETNYAFRAWHDWCHWKGGYEFNRQGEIAVCSMQQDHVRTLYGREGAVKFHHMLAIEVVGQFDFAGRNCHFPRDQHAFMVRELAKRGYR